MSLEDAIHLAIIALKEGFEGAIDENNIEVIHHLLTTSSCHALPCSFAYYRIVAPWSSQ
jgi:20S proteasome alpha/beta subunit